MTSTRSLTVNDSNKTENEGATGIISSPSLVLIDENQWVEQLRQQYLRPSDIYNLTESSRECMPNSEAKLKSRMDKFIELATISERNELEEARDQLWTLMKAAKTEDQLKNPDYSTTPMPTSQRFKKHYNSFVESGYGFSKHLDIFVDQAPDYVSLVWGAIKILMIVQISNQELKENVHSHLGTIARKFELVDHLPDLIPQKNLVEAVSEAYGLFSKFLAKAVKYYSECRARRYIKAFVSPWKTRFQEIVDEIDTALDHINGITQARSYMTAESNLAISGQILEVDKKMWNVIQHIPEAIQKLGAELKTIHFEKAIDIFQTTSIMQQRLEERFSNPRAASAPAEHLEEDKNRPLGEDIMDIFTDLRDFEAEREEAEAAKSAPETTEQRTKRRNMLQSEEIITWIESQESQLLWIDGSYLLRRSHLLASFITPLTIDAACNYESITILKHFCGSNLSTRNSCLALLQALVSQFIKQHPEIAEGNDAKISRSNLTQAAKDFTKLWELLRGCLTFFKSHHKLNRVYIIIGSIDELQAINMDDYNLLMARLHDLIRQDDLLVKILLSSRVLSAAPIASDISNSLSVPHRKWDLLPFEKNLPMLQTKFTEIQEGRCKSITFPQLMLLYPPRTLIFTKVGDAFRAYIVFEVSGATEMMPGRFDPLHLRVWSVDHNGTYLTKRYVDLDITQFSGSRELKDLRYIPAGYLPDESRIMNVLIERGRRYWELVEKPQLSYSLERDIAHVMIDQGYRTLHEVSQQELDDQFQKTRATDLKVMMPILCPHVVRAYDLCNLKWIEVEIDKLPRSPKTFNEHKFFDQRVLWANISEYLNNLHDNTSHQAKFIEGKRMGLFILLRGQAKVELKNACAKFGLPLLVVNMGILINSTDMDAQLQEYMVLARRWTAVLYFKNIDQLSKLGSGSNSGSMASEITFYHRLKSFQGIAALGVNKEFSDVSEEFYKFKPWFRVACRVDEPNVIELWDYWEECLNQMSGYGGGRASLQEFVEGCGPSEGPKSRESIVNFCHNLLALAKGDVNKLSQKDFIRALQEIEAHRIDTKR